MYKYRYMGGIYEYLYIYIGIARTTNSSMNNQCVGPLWFSNFLILMIRSDLFTFRFAKFKAINFAINLFFYNKSITSMTDLRLAKNGIYCWPITMKDMEKPKKSVFSKIPSKFHIQRILSMISIPSKCPYSLCCLSTAA